VESHFPVHGTVIAETPYVVSYFFNRDSLRRPLLDIVGGEVTRPETPHVVPYWISGLLTSSPTGSRGLLTAHGSSYENKKPAPANRSG